MRCLFCKDKFEKKYRWQMGRFKFCLSTEECKSAWSEAVVEKQKLDAEKKRRSNSRNKRTIHSAVYQTDNKKDLQVAINTIIRMIDKGVRCVDCTRTESLIWDAGHLQSVGSNSTLRYHLDNIFIQTRYCNSFSEGNKGSFKEGLTKMYGNVYLTHVEGLNQRYGLLKIHHSEYPEILKEARKIVRELKKADTEYPPKVRIRLRKEINKRLNIYKPEI